jgi:hypothetical protein
VDPNIIDSIKVSLVLQRRHCAVPHTQAGGCVLKHVLAQLRHVTLAA